MLNRASEIKDFSCKTVFGKPLEFFDSTVKLFLFIILQKDKMLLLSFHECFEKSMKISYIDVSGK